MAISYYNYKDTEHAPSQSFVFFLKIGSNSRFNLTSKQKPKPVRESKKTALLI